MDLLKPRSYNHSSAPGASTRAPGQTCRRRRRLLRPQRPQRPQRPRRPAARPSAVPRQRRPGRALKEFHLRSADSARILTQISWMFCTPKFKKKSGTSLLWKPLQLGSLIGRTFNRCRSLDIFNQWTSWNPVQPCNPGNPVLRLVASGRASLARGWSLENFCNLLTSSYLFPTFCHILPDSSQIQNQQDITRYIEISEFLLDGRIP